MRRIEETSPISDERLERLICRRLDGEMSAAEQAELEAALAADPVVQALFDEYAANDALAGQVLRRDYEDAIAVGAGNRRGLWLAAAGALLAAAAVVAFSFVPHWLGDSVSPASQMAGMQAPASVRHGPPPQFVDYREIDLRPRHRERRTWRDFIGIRNRKPDANVIYILERNRRSDRITPVSSDF